MTNTTGKQTKGPRAEKSAGKSPRRRARELALQGLYQWRIGGNDEAAIEAHLADVEGFDKADREFFVGLLRGVLAQQAELQEQLQTFLDRPFIYWPSGIALCAVSALISLRIIRKKC